MVIARENFLSKIAAEFEIHQVCALLGPRQSGKTTLARNYAEKLDAKVVFYDCENPTHLAKLESPMLAFENSSNLIVIDEIQLRPDLFPVIRVLVDENPSRKFLILGSASRDLIRQSSETLAGRIGYQQITPFSVNETQNWKQLWHRGGFPKSFLAKSDLLSERWRSEYIKTFLERDVLNLGFDITPSLLSKLWRMIAYLHGQILKIHSLSQSLGIDQRTTKKYLEILEGAFMIRLLRPFHTNLGKREVKSPKIYIRDTGLLHSLLGLSGENVEFNPALGSSFEGFVIEEIIRHFDGYDQSYFWSTHSGSELDLLLKIGPKRIGFEVKYTDHPKITKSMHSALENLNLYHLYVIIPGSEHFRMNEKITCIGVMNIKEVF